LEDKMGAIEVVRSSSRDGWIEIKNPPGKIPSACQELTDFSSGGEAFTTGLWEREPDSWPFERAYDEVAVIIRGRADIETDNGQKLSVGPGDVLVTPKGTKGIWHIHETIVKFFAIYDAKQASSQVPDEDR
jgi:uncharacterized cupin superfamily protein